MVWGSPRYMAPERVRGVGKDPRSDIYSIGCIAFELLIGAPPFLGTSDDIIRGHLKEVPEPPSKWRPSLGIPQELDALDAEVPGEGARRALPERGRAVRGADARCPAIRRRRPRAGGGSCRCRSGRPTGELPAEGLRNVRGALRAAAERAARSRRERRAARDRHRPAARSRAGARGDRRRRRMRSSTRRPRCAIPAATASSRCGSRSASCGSRRSKPARPPDIALQIRDLEERLEVALAVSKRLAELESALARTTEERAVGARRG